MSKLLKSLPIVFSICLAGCGGSSDSSSSSMSTSSSASSSSSSGIADYQGFQELNDTGRTVCATLEEEILPCGITEFPGQDAEFGRDSNNEAGELVKIGGGEAGFDFSKLGSDGMPLPIQDQSWHADGDENLGTIWSCVLDNTTQLTWEVKHSTPTHPRYGLSTYSWYNASTGLNGGIAGVAHAGDCNEGLCDTEGYVSYINSIQLCGFNDWRMPSTSELLSIGHLGRGNPAIEVNYFPNTLGLRHWTADTVAAVPQIAWYVYFSDASISYTDKSNRSVLRLVRSHTTEEAF